MTTLGRWWRWLEPGLLYIEPMVAIGYVELAHSNEPSPEPDLTVAARNHGWRAERHVRERRLSVHRS